MSENYSKIIMNGMLRYMRLLGAAQNMEHTPGDVEWITPKPAYKGPSMVYFVELDIQSAASRLDKMADDIKRERMPALWLIQPDSTPPDLIEMLKIRGFRDISDPMRPEIGMTLELTGEYEQLPAPAGIGVRRVETPEDFSLWISIVNEALFGWPMLDAENYGHLPGADGVALYLSLVDGEPAGCAATIKSGSTATLEFVSTHKSFKGRGAAKAVCAHALCVLAGEGVRLVTLRAGHETVGFYKELGFTEYFKTVVMKL